MGIAKTLQRLQQNFFWTGMMDDVHRYVSQCLICQQKKYETKKSAGLLQPLPIPSTIWEDLSLDFITSLPQSHGFNTILVVVDRFSRGAHFGVLPPETHSVQSCYFIHWYSVQITWLPSQSLIQQGPTVYKQVLARAFPVEWKQTKDEHLVPIRNWRPNQGLEQSALAIPLLFCSRQICCSGLPFFL